MAEESINLPVDNIDYHIVTLFEKLENLRKETQNAGLSTTIPARQSMQNEIRTMELFRSVFAECVASMFYVLIVCGAAAGAGPSASTASILLATALAAGFTMTMLTQCLLHLSGAHINPAVTLAMVVTRRISLLRGIMFITAQCGGGIAGAALLYGWTVPGYQGNLQAAITHTASLAAWERFGVECTLTFIVVFSYFAAMEPSRKLLGHSALTIGAAYSACSFVSMPYLNPARSLGPCLVLSKWDNHWVYWIGPLVGGVISGLVYEYLCNPNRQQRYPKESIDGDSSSINSDEDNYDDLDKPTQPKFHGSTYNTYRPASGTGTAPRPSGYCASLAGSGLYSAASKLDRGEPLYGGTKSLYCKSPPLTRANLNRSQSVYTKSSSALNRDIAVRPGPLVPAQSLYPMRLNQPQNQAHVQNQNVQNQMQQRSEGIYGVRGVAAGVATRSDSQGYNQAASTGIYGTRANPTGGNATVMNKEFESREDNPKFNRAARPESMYGGRRGGQANQSDDSSYGSYHGSNTAPRTGGSGGTGGNFTNSNSAQNFGKNIPGSTGTSAQYPQRGGDRGTPSETRQNPTNSTGNPPGNYAHRQPQPSPNPQY